MLLFPVSTLRQNCHIRRRGARNPWSTFQFKFASFSLHCMAPSSLGRCESVVKHFQPVAISSSPSLAINYHAPRQSRMKPTQKETQPINHLLIKPTQHETQPINHLLMRSANYLLSPSGLWKVLLYTLLVNVFVPCKT